MEQEEEYGEDGDAEALRALGHDAVELFLEGRPAVFQQFHMDIGGQFQAIYHCQDGVGNFDGVAVGQAQDGHRNGGVAVSAGNGAGLGGVNYDPGHIGKGDGGDGAAGAGRRAAALETDGDAAYGIQVGVAVISPQGQRAVALLDGAGVEVNGVAGYGGDDTLDGEVVFVQAFGVNDNGDALGDAALDGYIIDAVDGFQGGYNLVVDDAAEGGNIAVAGNAVAHYGENVGGNPHYGGSAGVVGEVQAADAAGNFVLRVFSVGAGNEIGRYDGGVGRGNGSDPVQVGHTDDGVLNRLGNLAGDGNGVALGVAGPDDDAAEADVGEQLLLEAVIRIDAAAQRQEHHHYGYRFPAQR